MSQIVAQQTTNDLQIAARAIAQSGLFSIKNENQALALMLIAQAEGRHPAMIALEYDIINGRPSKKAEAMQRDFIANGGSIKWIELNDIKAEAIFSHPQGGEVTISWDMRRATAAGLGGRDMWKKYPRQMLRSRVVSEGVRTVFPLATSGMYVPEEVQDFEPKEADIVEVKVSQVESVEQKINPALDSQSKNEVPFDIELMDSELGSASDIEGYFEWYSTAYKYFVNCPNEEQIYQEFGRRFEGMIMSYSDVSSLQNDFNKFRSAFRMPLYNKVRDAVTGAISTRYHELTGAAA